MKDYIDEATLAKKLQEHYDIDIELARKKTKSFIEKMEKNGLIEKQEG